MKHRISIVQTIRRLQSIALVAVAMFIPFATRATTVKALSFAINESSGSNEGEPIKTYMATNDVDFGVFDNTKKPSYFIGSDFSQDGKSFKVVFFDSTPTGGNRSYKLVIYDSDKYELVNTPADDMSSHNVAAVFEDAYGDQYALISIRGTYTASGVNTYVSGIATKYPVAKIIVTYNERVGSSNATTLNGSLTTGSGGPQMTCLGRTDVDGTAVGGVYMYPADVPESYSVNMVPKLLKANGTDTIKYNGTLLTFEVPTKYKVIFNDWDGTGLQTNIVFVGESVTPPVPQRDGYTFTGWDHDDSEFSSVTASFTATAQYATDDASLLVFGNPENFGTANPAYGTAASIAVGDSFTASVTATNLLESGIERYVCTGFTHYEITDVVTGAKTVAQEGNVASFAYTHVLHDELVWHFTNEWLVVASAKVGGSVSAAESWVRNGDAVVLVATPGEGYEFWRWDGDTDGIADVSSASITAPVTSSRELFAVFKPAGVSDPSVQYVSPTGNDVNDGYSAALPKQTIQAAIDLLSMTPGYGTVHVAPGLYATETNPGVAVTNAIAVIGETGNPEDVILRNTKTKSDTSALTLFLDNPDAFVANLVIENGHRYQPQSSPYGANLAIESSGGTVSNCVIRGGSWNGFYVRGLGAWLNSDAALLTHCIVTNNTSAGTGRQAVYTLSGSFVHVEKGTVANCLIANNTNTGGTDPVGGAREAATCSVAVMDGCILNSTVVTNEARYTGGVYLDAKGYATNVVVAGCVNKCTFLDGDGNPKFTDTGFKGALTHASHCASDDWESDEGGELDETCVRGTAAEFFADMAGRDYRPAANSPLVNSGATYVGIAEIDLLGKNRVQGRFVDIGAYESSSRGFYIIVR